MIEKETRRYGKDRGMYLEEFEGTPRIDEKGVQISCLQCRGIRKLLSLFLQMFALIVINIFTVYTWVHRAYIMET